MRGCGRKGAGAGAGAGACSGALLHIQQLQLQTDEVITNANFKLKNLQLQKFVQNLYLFFLYYILLICAFRLSGNSRQKCK